MTMSMTPAATAACANHPAREAVGICVRCRTRVCVECTTKVDGINYCVSCLGELAAAGRRERTGAGQGRQSAGLFSATVHLGLLVVLIWGLLEVILPGASG